MSFIPWPEIVGFHNIRNYLKIDSDQGWQSFEFLNGNSTVTYKSKIKLHGMNHAVQVIRGDKKTTVVSQSRTTELSITKDNMGFAKWVSSNEQAWQAAAGHIIFGELVGPGIQKSNVAVSSLPAKIFVVFAARPLDDNNQLIVEPSELIKLVSGVPNTYVLPWFKSIDINWKQTDEELNNIVSIINEWVMTVEDNDPWVDSLFGIKGMGEGLVFYPVSHPGLENFKNLAFKAKGTGHRIVKQSFPAQVNPEIAASIDEFVDMVLTEARLEQGATTISESNNRFDKKKTGQFVFWVVSDVKKETQDELLASHLTWEQVEKSLVAKARTWYLARVSK